MAQSISALLHLLVIFLSLNATHSNSNLGAMTRAPTFYLEEPCAIGDRIAEGDENDSLDPSPQAPNSEQQSIPVHRSGKVGFVTPTTEEHPLMPNIAEKPTTGLRDQGEFKGSGVPHIEDRERERRSSEFEKETTQQDTFHLSLEAEAGQTDVATSEQP